MIRVLPAVLEFALLVFCLIDCVQSDRDRIRNLPKAVWIVLILLVPVVGAVVWLVAGRPHGSARGRGAPSRLEHRSATATGFPEDDRPRRLAEAAAIDDRVAQEQARVDAEHEAAVRRAQARAAAREIIESREPRS